VELLAAISDDIAYDAHDIDDGLRAGLFAIDDLKVMPLLAEMIGKIDAHYPGLDQDRRGAELVRELISHFIGSVVSEARKRLDAAHPMSPDDVRHYDKQLVAFAPAVTEAEADIKTFLKQHMYRHPRVMRVMGEAEDIVANLFARYLDDPAALPAEWQDGIAQEGDAARARRIGNFIAGMTDRFALTEHQRLFDSTPELR
jgi:dGTPase